MTSVRTITRCRSVVIAGLMLLSVSARVGAEITLESLLREMTSHEVIARWPQPEFTCHQASSYDRQTVSPDKPGWFANNDHTQFVRTEINGGRREQVMLDVAGPGALVRFWLTTANERQGSLRIYLDQNETPTLTFPAYDLLAGDLKIGEPLAQPHPGYGPKGGGNTLYLPIPFAKHCKVTWEEKSKGPRYYQINYRTYTAGTAVTTFDVRQAEAARKAIDGVNTTLTTPSRHSAGKVSAFEEILIAGAAKSLELPDGSAAIRDLELRLETTDAAEAERAFRSTIVQMSFDDEVTVWCPATDFFGSGVGINELHGWYRSVKPDGVMQCGWVMPYARNARITLINTGTQSVKAKLRAVTSTWDWDDRSMHFHTAWHHESGLTTPPDRDWNFIRITGRGVFAGDSLALFNPVSTWYGEGDEKIRVDGEPFPSHMGTGTEDYYGYSFAPKGIFQTPFNNQVRIDEPMTQGHNVMSRTRQLDGIPFRQSLQFDMELTAWKPTTLTYAATTYWYAFPGAVCNIKPQPKEAAMPIPTLAEAKRQAQAARPRRPGAIEGESLKVVRKSGEFPVSSQDMQPWGAERWSNGEHLIAKATNVGASLELDVPASEGQPRQIVLYATQAPDYGTLKFRINGQASEATFDGYADKVQLAEPLKLGVFQPKDGRFLVQAEVTGANPKANGPRFFFAFDCFVLEDPMLRTVHSQPSLALSTPQVDLAVTPRPA